MVGRGVEGRGRAVRTVQQADARLSLTSSTNAVAHHIFIEIMKIQHRHLGFSEAWTQGDSLSVTFGTSRKVSRSLIFPHNRAWGTKSYFTTARAPTDFGRKEDGFVRLHGPFGGRYHAGVL